VNVRSSYGSLLPDPALERSEKGGRGKTKGGKKTDDRARLFLSNRGTRAYRQTLGKGKKKVAAERHSEYSHRRCLGPSYDDPREKREGKKEEETPGQGGEFNLRAGSSRSYAGVKGKGKKEKGEKGEGKRLVASSSLSPLRKTSLFPSLLYREEERKRGKKGKGESPRTGLSGAIHYWERKCSNISSIKEGRKESISVSC